MSMIVMLSVLAIVAILALFLMGPSTRDSARRRRDSTSRVSPFVDEPQPLSYAPWISDAALEPPPRAVAAAYEGGGAGLAAAVEEPTVAQLKQEAIWASELDVEQRAQEYCADTSRWDLLVSVGDTYARGKFPVLKPDTVGAELCYRAAAMSPDGDTAGVAQMKLLELKMSPVPLDDVSDTAIRMNPEPGRRMYAAATVALQAMPWSSFRTPKFRSKRQQQQQQDDEVVVADNGGDLIQRNARDREAHGYRYDVVVEEQHQHQHQHQHQEFRTDAQNVHDHAVTQVIAKNLDGISTKDAKSKDVQADDAHELIQEVLKSRELDTAQKADAVSVIQGMSDSVHSRFHQSEREVLSNVWRKIKASDDPVLRKNLTETLTKQLSTAVEAGLIVCSSGKIARMTSALEGSGLVQETSRPMWAIRDELGTLAHKVQGEGGSGADFAAAARRLYVEDLGMNAAIVEPVIAEYAEHV